MTRRRHRPHPLVTLAGLVAVGVALYYPLCWVGWCFAWASQTQWGVNP